jgi:tryptophanyl-tRNA synthetase
MGLDDPTKKMSGSEMGAGHSINLLDSPDAIRAKIMRATTDSLREIRFDEGRPGIYNLLTMYQSITGQDKKEIEAKYQGQGYSDFKKDLAEVVVESLRPLQERYQELTAVPGHIDSILAEGAKKARPLAEKTLEQVKSKVGLG